MKQLKKTLFRMLGMKNYLRLMQRGFSCAYHSGYLRKNPWYSFHYLDGKLIRRGDYIADIGANLGYYSKLFSKWTGPEGKVYSIEPIGLYNEVFRRYTRGRQNIELMPYALGAEDKEIELVTSLDQGGYHTGLPHVYDKGSDGELESHDFRFKARMRVPDELFGGVERLDFIKCDVEGFEQVVIRNMMATIEKHLPVIQVEIRPENQEQIMELLERKGYAVYKLDRNVLIADKGRFGEIEGDFLFVPPGRVDRLREIEVQ